MNLDKLNVSIKEVENAISELEDLLSMAYSFRVRDEDNVTVFKVERGWVIRGTRGPTYFYHPLEKNWMFAPAVVDFDKQETYDLVVENLKEAIKIARSAPKISKDMF